jgi:hypothetical protein
MINLFVVSALVLVRVMSLAAAAGHTPVTKPVTRLDKTHDVPLNRLRVDHP